MADIGHGTTDWLTGIGAKLAAFGLLLLALLGTVLRILSIGKKAGQNEVIAKDKAATVQAVEKAHAAQARVDALSPSELDKKLDEWTRPD